MSFWGGMARGFKDASEKKERDQAVERQQERLSIEDARYQSETERAERYRSEDIEFRTQEFKVRQEQLAHDRKMAELAESRLQKGQEFQQGEVWEHTVKMADYGKSRDVVADLRADRDEAFKQAQFEFQKERATVGDEQALKNFDLRVQQFQEQQRATGVSEANWDKSFQASQENIDREWLNKIEMQDYGKSRDVVADLRADAQVAAQAARDLFEKEKFQVGTAMAERQFGLRMQQFDEQLRATGVSEEFREKAFANSNEQWAKGYQLQVNADTRAQEAVEIDRITTLASLMPAGLTSSLGGGTAAKGTKGDSTVMSAEAITEGATMYHNEYQNLSEDAKNSDFFKMLKGDAGTQASMMAFITAQAKKGNTVTLQDLPKYFKYAGTIEGKGEAEAQEALEMLTSGEGITDVKSFTKGLVAFKNYKPTKHLFQQTGTPSDLDDLDKQMKFWETATETEAFKSLSGLPDGIKQETQQALAQMEEKATRVQGLSKLAELGFGKAAAEKHNLLDNSVIGSFYTSEEAAVTPPGAGTGTAPTGTAPGASVEPSNSPVQGEVFNSWAEVEEARNNGFSGTATVGGQVYNIAPVEGPEGLTQGSVAPEQGAADGVDESGFSVSNVDTSLKPVPELDALFEEVMTEGAQPKTVIPDNRPIREPQTIEEIESGIEGALEGEALEEKVVAVEEELFDLGVYEPTNVQELAYFKEDLNVLISDLEIQIPPEVLKGVVENVIARVTYKADGPKDYSRPEAEQVEEGMDWGNRKGRILDTPDDELDARARRNTGRSGDRGPLPSRVKEEEMDWDNRRGRVLRTPDDELDARARRNTGRSR